MSILYRISGFFVSRYRLLLCYYFYYYVHGGINERKWEVYVQNLLLTHSRTCWVDTRQHLVYHWVSEIALFVRLVCWLVNPRLKVLQIPNMFCEFVNFVVCRSETFEGFIMHPIKNKPVFVSHYWYNGLTHEEISLVVVLRRCTLEVTLTLPYSAFLNFLAVTC